MRMLMLACTALTLVPGLVTGQTTADAPTGLPTAIVDLRSSTSLALVHGGWRTQVARLVAVDHRAPGPDLRASGRPVRTLDLEPHAGGADFDDRSWQAIPAESLEARKGNGRVSFVWYRTSVTLPAGVGEFDPTGATVVLELVADDYAEIWVDGQLPLVLGQSGGALVRGFNAPNRVVLTRDARPGMRFQLAVLVANGPLSSPPANFIWVRSATLDFFRPEDARVAAPAGGTIQRLDPALDDLVAPDAIIEKLAGGFRFTEGPVWVADGNYLLFSDPNANTIYRWTTNGEVSVYRTKSGYTGIDIGRYHQPGSNGLALDADGRVTIDQHGNRRVIRVERTGAITVLADRYQGRRLNSPNDLVYRSDGALFFTDPPFGLPKVFDDPAKELPFSGVYMVRDGAVTLLTRDLSGPNGIAFSPDERVLYVSNWDPGHKVIMAYDVVPDGTLSGGRVFYDITASEPGDDAWDGLKVDQQGNLFAAGPRGIYVLSPSGKLLGVISPPEHVANFAWGDSDRRTLYITASTGLYRIRMASEGTAAFPVAQASAR
jgi:gluconolactonase